MRTINYDIEESINGVLSRKSNFTSGMRSEGAFKQLPKSNNAFDKLITSPMSRKKSSTIPLKGSTPSSMRSNEHNFYRNKSSSFQPIYDTRDESNPIDKHYLSCKKSYLQECDTVREQPEPEITSKSKEVGAAQVPKLNYNVLSKAAGVTKNTSLEKQRYSSRAARMAEKLLNARKQGIEGLIMVGTESCDMENSHDQQYGTYAAKSYKKGALPSTLKSLAPAERMAEKLIRAREEGRGLVLVSSDLTEVQEKHRQTLHEKERNLTSLKNYILSQNIDNEHGQSNLTSKNAALNGSRCLSISPYKHDLIQSVNPSDKKYQINGKNSDLVNHLNQMVMEQEISPTVKNVASELEPQSNTEVKGADDSDELLNIETLPVQMNHQKVTEKPHGNEKTVPDTNPNSLPIPTSHKSGDRSGIPIDYTIDYTSFLKRKLHSNKSVMYVSQNGGRDGIEQDPIHGGQIDEQGQTRSSSTSTINKYTAEAGKFFTSLVDTMAEVTEPAVLEAMETINETNAFGLADSSPKRSEGDILHTKNSIEADETEGTRSQSGFGTKSIGCFGLCASTNLNDELTSTVEEAKVVLKESSAFFSSLKGESEEVTKRN